MEEKMLEAAAMATLMAAIRGGHFPGLTENDVRAARRTVTCFTTSAEIKLAGTKGRFEANIYVTWKEEPNQIAAQLLTRMYRAPGTKKANTSGTWWRSIVTAEEIDAERSRSAA